MTQSSESGLANAPLSGGRLSMSDDLTVHRVGYGAMQLIDVHGGWPAARHPVQLRQAVHDNLMHLGMEVLVVVNLRIPTGQGNHTPRRGSIAESFSVVADLQRERLVRHLDVSTATAARIIETQAIAPVLCMQNLFNLANRGDDLPFDSLRDQGIAYVPYFPLRRLSSSRFDSVAFLACRHAGKPIAVTLAWLLQRSPNIQLIPGTASTAYVKENLSAADLHRSAEDLSELNRVTA